MKRNVELTITLLLVMLNCVSSISVQAEVASISALRYTTIRVKFFHLNSVGEKITVPAVIPCTVGDAAYGCGYTQRVDGSWAPGYPYATNPATIDIETEYLPNVVPFETNPRRK